MFPYNHAENDWLSGKAKSIKNPEKHSLAYSLLFALLSVLFSTLTPPFIYFSKLNLF